MTWLLVMVLEILGAMAVGFVLGRIWQIRCDLEQQIPVNQPLSGRIARATEIRQLHQQSQFGPTSAQALPWFRLTSWEARTGAALGGTGLCLEDYRLR